MNTMILGVAALAALVVQHLIFSNLVKDLNNRLMAKSLEEYKYFTEMFKGEVKEVEKLRDDARSEKKEEESKEEVNTDVYEEDWDKDEIDIDKVKEAIRKEDEK